jgi:3-oxoadipate enol-lactonase
MSEAVRFIVINGVRTAYLDEGQGQPIVFIHGWSMAKSYWNAQLLEFSTCYRTIAYDLPGMGQSDGGGTAYAFTDLVIHLQDFMAAIGVHSPILCGHSMGGAVALAYAETPRNDVFKLILVGTSVPDKSDKELAQNFEKTVNACEFRTTASHCETLFYSEPFIERHPAVILDWMGQFLSNSPKVLVNGLNAWAERSDPVPALRSIIVPTLLIWGSLDQFVREVDMEKLSRIPQSCESIIEGAGHTSMQENPAVFNETVKSFAMSTRS